MRLSATFRLSKSARFWNVRATPRRATATGRSPVSGWSSNAMRPTVGTYMPLMQLNSEDLPAPFGPMIPISSPGRTVRLTSSKIEMPPTPKLTFSIRSSVVMPSLLRQALDKALACMDRPAALRPCPLSRPCPSGTHRHSGTARGPWLRSAPPAAPWCRRRLSRK